VGNLGIIKRKGDLDFGSDPDSSGYSEIHCQDEQ